MAGNVARGLGVLVLTAVLPALAAASPPEWPSAERAFEMSRTPAYLREVKQALASPEADPGPDVLHEILMIAALERDAALVKDAKTRLAVDHPDALQTAYMLSTFGKADDCRAFLKDLSSPGGDLTRKFARAYCQALETSLRLYGQDLLGGDDFLLRSALLADIAGRSELLALVRKRIEEKGSEQAREIDRIAGSFACSDAAKFLSLHAIDHNAAEPLRRFYLEKLSADDRRQPDVALAIAERHLAAGEYDQAFPVLDELLADEQPQRMVYWAWCQTQRGNRDEALAKLEDVRKHHASSDWAATAKELAGAIREADASYQANVDAVLALLGELRRAENDCLEGKFLFHGDGDRKVEIYVGVVAASGDLEIVLADRGRTLLAYRIAEGQARAYFQGEPAIHAFRHKPLYLAPSLQASVNEKDINFNWNCQFTNSPVAMAAAKQTLAESPMLRTRPEVALAVRHLGKKWLPAPVEKRDGETVFAWLSLDVKKPGLKRFEFRTPDDGSRAAFRTGAFECTALRVGKRDAFRFDAPQWPDLPVVSHDAMDAGVMFRMLGAVTSLFFSDAQATASQPTPSRR